MASEECWSYGCYSLERGELKKTTKKTGANRNLLRGGGGTVRLNNNTLIKHPAFTHTLRFTHIQTALKVYSRSLSLSLSLFSKCVCDKRLIGTLKKKTTEEEKQRTSMKWREGC